MSFERTESMARAIRMMADGGYTLTDASFSWTRTTEELSEDSLLSSDSLTGGEGNDVDNSGVGHDSSTPSPLPFDGGDASELSDEVSPPTTDGRYDDGYRDGQRDGYIAGRDGVLARLRPTTDEDAEAFYETFGYTAATWDQLHRHEQDGYRRTLDAAIAVAQERGLVPPMRKLPEWCTPELVAEVERLRAVITEAIDRLTRHQPAERDVRHCGSCGFTYPCPSRWLRDDLSAALKGTTDDR